MQCATPSQKEKKKLSLFAFLGGLLGLLLFLFLHVGSEVGGRLLHDWDVASITRAPALGVEHLLGARVLEQNCACTAKTSGCKGNSHGEKGEKGDDRLEHYFYCRNVR